MNAAIKPIDIKGGPLEMVRAPGIARALDQPRLAHMSDADYALSVAQAAWLEGYEAGTRATLAAWRASRG